LQEEVEEWNGTAYSWVRIVHHVHQKQRIETVRVCS